MGRQLRAGPVHRLRSGRSDVPGQTDAARDAAHRAGPGLQIVKYRYRLVLTAHDASGNKGVAGLRFKYGAGRTGRRWPASVRRARARRARVGAMATATARERSGWGWGFADAAFTAAQAREAAPGVVAALGFGTTDVEDPVPVAGVALPPPGSPRRTAAPGCGRATTPARVPRARAVLPGRRAYAARGLRARPRPRRAAGRRARGRGGPGLGRGRRGGGGALRRRDERRRRRRAARPRALRGGRAARPGRPRRAARGRPGLAGGADRGRGQRPAARGAARRARAHAALLPAVVRALDARRVGGHARGRALRHAADPRRRRRRSGAGDHPDAGRGPRGACPAAAPARRRTGCCWAARGRSGSSPRRGCACSRARRTGPRAPCASRASPRARRACGRSSRAACCRPTCRLLDPLEAQMSTPPAPARASARCWSSASSRPTTRSTTAQARPGAVRGARRRRRRAAPRTRRRGAGAGAWRAAFLRMPYLRDLLIRLGVLADTFETAIHVGPPARLPRRRQAGRRGRRSGSPAA